MIELNVFAEISYAIYRLTSSTSYRFLVGEKVEYSKLPHLQSRLIFTEAP